MGMAQYRQQNKDIKFFIIRHYNVHYFQMQFPHYTNLRLFSLNSDFVSSVPLYLKYFEILHPISWIKIFVHEQISKFLIYLALI